MIVIQTLKASLRQTQKSTFLDFIQAFVNQLRAQEYVEASVKPAARLVRDFVAWLDLHKTERSSLSAAHVVDYLDFRWLHRRRRRGDGPRLQSAHRAAAGGPDGGEHTTSGDCGGDSAIAHEVKGLNCALRWLTPVYE